MFYIANSLVNRIIDLILDNLCCAYVLKQILIKGIVGIVIIYLLMCFLIILLIMHHSFDNCDKLIHPNEQSLLSCWIEKPWINYAKMG